MGSGLLKLGPATMPPGDCFICSCRPVDDEGRPHPMIYPEGMDINWGEVPYICWDCAGIISDLIGRPDEEKVKATVRGARLQKKHNEKLIVENEKLRTIVGGLVDGQDMIDQAKELMSSGD